MKLDLDFTCPLTRADMDGLATMGHCPQCDLDIPELSNLTHDEARRVLSAIECAQDMSANLHLCAAYAQREDGDVHFTDPRHLPEDLPPEVASLFDDRATFLLALSAVAALGFSLNSVLISQIYAPVSSGADVFTLGPDGPRFEPALAERDADALDAGQDAWLTINLANIRADLSSVFAPETTPEDLLESHRVREERAAAAEAYARAARADQAWEDARRRDQEHAELRARRHAEDLERAGVAPRGMYTPRPRHRLRGKPARRNHSPVIVIETGHEK